MFQALFFHLMTPSAWEGSFASNFSFFFSKKLAPFDFLLAAALWQICKFPKILKNDSNFHLKFALEIRREIPMLF